MIENDDVFWLKHPDPTQASVHLALQWLAFVYPASELQIDGTLKSALPYADTDLSARWSQFLETHEVEKHVDALQWISQNLSAQQVPFLVETCWRLLLVDHELPTHVPLALRIMGQVLSIDEGRMYEIGENVHREATDGSEEKQRAPLLPLDPRYLDRVEWRLYGHSSTHRSVYRTGNQIERDNRGIFGFMWGSLVGALVVVGLVFGPLQMGRITVSRIMPEADILRAQEPAQPATTQVQAPVDSTPVVPLAAEQVAPVATDSLPEITLVESPAVETPAVQSAIEPVAPATEIPVSENTVPVPEPSVPVPTPVQVAVVEPAPVADVALPSDRVLMEVTASLLNVREVPRVDGDVVIKLAESARVWAYPDESQGLWMLVRVQGESGYVSARFLQEVQQ